MTGLEIFEELRFVLELMAAHCALLFPFAKRKDFFPLRFALAIAVLCVCSMGYFPLQHFTADAPYNLRGLYVVWYFFLSFLTVPISRFCFDLSISEALYTYIAGYAVQHIIYVLIHGLTVRYLWPGLAAMLPLYILISAAVTGLVCFAVGSIFAPQLLLCGGRMFEDTKRTIVTLAFVLAVFIGCAFTCQNLFENFAGTQWLGAGLGLMISLLILCLEYGTLRAVRNGQERTVMEQILRDSEGQYDLTREMVEHINRTCHDLKHNLEVLKIISESERQSYIEQTEQDIARFHELVHTDDEVLNTILASKSLYCDNRGVKLSCVVDSTKLDFVSIPDLYALMGNAIDNAVECVEQLPDPNRKLISLTINGTEGFVFIQTNNYCDRTLQMEGGLPVSTKPDKSAHGFGLKSIRFVAEKYGGSMCVSVEEDVFILQVSLPVPPANDMNPC